NRTAPTLQIQAGKTAVVFFTLQLTNVWQLPASLQHLLHFRSRDGVDHALAAKPLPVEPRAPVVVDAPLRGTDWIAGDAEHEAPDAAHRRAILFDRGEPFLAQRYAIDWVRYRIVNGVGTTWSGPENQNSSYFCYNAPVYSMTSGTVSEVLDGIPENVPHSGRMAIDVNFSNAGGNSVVIYIGYGLYAFYAHMRPGSIRVKVGGHVSVGEIVGRVGNSGNSTEPHLHEHIVNRPSFLAGQGVPYEFARFDASGPVELVSKAHHQMYFQKIGRLKPFTYDYPAANAAVSFR
ncbi:MAG: M23 family metallopeptidase, partial [Acidobacteriaceae bacterium]|nr:M23 family metallopeptidase [Acidobacteriaceae bacterium]